MKTKINLQSVLLTVVAALSGLWSGCGDRLPVSESRVSTDLDITGNARVARNFQTYRDNSAGGCSSGGSQGRRILISGFGPFNRQNNISGAVVDVLQRHRLWPEVQTWPEDGEFAAPEFAPDDSSGSLGAKAVQRTVRYDGRTLEVCLLKLSVEWDFAAAVILHEAEKFRPDFILMTGYGSDLTGVRLEAAALNDTTRLSGFDPAGKALGDLNTPISKWVLPVSSDVPDVLEMQWDNQKISMQNRARLLQMSGALGRTETDERWKFVAMKSADPLNNYICNNVSFAVLASMQTASLPLAGGKLVLSPQFSKLPRAAFMHYPYEANVASTREVWMWTHLLLSVASSALSQSPSPAVF
jgi:hypothetical protein